MLKKIIAFILIILLLLPTFSSCAQKEKQVFESFEYFDTYSTLTIYGSKDEISPLFEEFDRTLSQYHKLLDIYNSYENTVNLKTLNDTAKTSTITVSPELFDILKFGIEMHKKTNGKLNIAIGSVTSLWHDIRETASVSPESITLPSEDTLTEALSHTNINAILLDEKNCSIQITDPKLSLDFGGLAKGYVASLLYKRLISLDCTDFLINLGGNVVSAGKKPDGTSWLTAIENPFSDNSLGYNKTISLDNETLVTSGSYQRYFIYEDKNYSHIIDSSNGYPPTFFTSVTVKSSSENSGLADALSTALFCMNYEEGYALISSLDDVEALWIFNDGSYKASDNFGGAK